MFGIIGSIRRRQDRSFQTRLKEQILEQAAVYAQVKNGDLSMVRYEKSYEKVNLSQHIHICGI